MIIIRTGHSKLSHLYLFNRSQSTIYKKCNIRTPTTSFFTNYNEIRRKLDIDNSLNEANSSTDYQDTLIRFCQSFSPNYSNSVNFYKSLIIYDVDATLSLLNKKKNP